MQKKDQREMTTIGEFEKILILNGFFQDDAYYERRRKNNDAAKRSRDQRRMKEELTAQRAHFLEQANIHFYIQI